MFSGSGPTKYAFMTMPDLVHGKEGKQRNSGAISQLTDAVRGPNLASPFGWGVLGRSALSNT
jgi:hypothetical protein